MVATTGSFTRAAAALNYAQSSITAQIQALEGDLGVRLFQRFPRRVALTDAGERFLQVAEEMLRLADHAVQVVRAREEPQGALVLSAPETLCSYWLPAVFRHFRKAHPRVRLVFRPAPVADFRRMVGEGVLDLAFVLEEPIAEGALHVESLFPVPMQVVAAPGHALTRARSVRALDLKGESVLLTELGCSYRNQFEHALIAAGAHPGPTLEFASVESIKQCVMAGLGVSILPHLSIRQELARGRMKILRWKDPPFHVQAQVVARPDNLGRPAVRAFLEAVRAHLPGS